MPTNLFKDNYALNSSCRTENVKKILFKTKKVRNVSWYLSFYHLYVSKQNLISINVYRNN